MNKIILLIFIPVFFVGCKKHNTCPEDSHYPYYITESDLTKIPYQKDGLDTLIYTSNGDTAILYGTGSKRDFAYHIYETSMACPSVDYNDYEILYYTFKGNHPNLSIITCHYQRSFFAPSGQGYFSRNFSKYSIRRGNNYRYDTNTLNDTTLYADSVLIGNFLYKGISAKGRKGPAEDIDNSLIVLYNYQYGMLRIIDNGKTWVRKF
jgi:hypothetical protein